MSGAAAITAGSFGKAQATIIHPDFLPLHAVLAGISESELRELHEAAVSFHTVLALYPVAMATYLPFFEQALATAGDVHRFWQLPALRGIALDEAIYTLMDTEVLTPFTQNQFNSRDVDALVKKAEQVHNHYSQYRWHKRGLMPESELRVHMGTLFETMMLLCYWNESAYKTMYPSAKEDLRRALAGVKAFLGTEGAES